MIFPVFLFVCIFLVYIGLYQYDRCVVEQSLRYAIVRGKELSHASEEEYEHILQEILERTLSEQYLIAVTGKTTSKTGYGVTELVYTGTMAVPWLGIVDNGIEDNWTVQVCGRAESWKPVSFIRICNRLKGE